MSRGFSGGFRGARGGFRGGRDSNFRNNDHGPPQFVEALGEMSHSCQGDLVCNLTNEKVPYFNAPVYLENKEQIGQVDEIYGPITKGMFTVKLLDNLKAKSFKNGQKFYISSEKLLTLERVLSNSAPRGAAQKRRINNNSISERGGRGRGFQRGGRGNFNSRGGGGRGAFGGRLSFRGSRGFRGPKRGH